MSSDLTGKFIANTYQKLLQVDNENGDFGSVSFSSTDQTHLNSTTKFDLLDGLGKTLPYLSVNHSGSNLGGIFLKNSSVENGTWGIQIANSGDDDDTPGLNIRKLGTNSGEAKLFLKRTGTTWIGYSEGVLGTVIPLPNDVSGYSLYVKNGVRVGNDTSGNNGRINLIGADPLQTGAGFFINGEYPFRIYRYQLTGTFIDDRSRKLEDELGNNFSITEWTSCVIGQQIIDYDGTVNSQIGLGITLRPSSDDFWEAYLYASNGDSSADSKLFIWDVLLIKKGFYLDRRLTTMVPIDLS